MTAPAPRRRPALEALAGLALLGLAAAAFLHQRALAPAMPYSDESAHLAKLVELADRLSQATGATWLHRLLLADDAYPNLTYALTLAWPGGAGSVAGARLSLLLYPLVHALVALLVARASWGRAAAWAYALLVLFSPVGLAYAPLYLVDLPLVATVGIALLLLERSAGFRHPGWSAAFALAAIAGMHAKWTWALFVAGPVLWAAWRACAASFPTRGARLLAAAGSAAGAGSLALLVLGAGRRLAAAGGPTQGARLWLPLTLVVAGLALAALWPVAARLLAARGRTVPPLANLGVATLAVALSAGTWYALVLRHLLGRLDHEQGQWTARGGNGLPLVEASLEAVRLMIPALGLLLALGLALELLRWRTSAGTLARLLGAAAAFLVLVASLPFDPRYLLPLLPVLAGAAVAGWRHAPRPARAGLLAAVALALLAGHLGAVLPRILAPRGSTTTWAAERWQIGPVLIPTVASRYPEDPLDAATVAAVTERIRALCAGERCEASYAPRLRGAQGRAFTALAGFEGLRLTVHEPAGRDGPLGRLVVRPGAAALYGRPARSFSAGTDCAAWEAQGGGRLEVCADGGP